VIQGLKPWQLSFLIHASLVVSFWIISNFKIPESEMVEVPVEISEPPPKEVQNLTEVKERPKVVLKSVNEPVPDSAPKREVFGASRNSYTDESLGNEGVEAKKGNTLTKEVDKALLGDEDADSLPTPTEEYLVSEMPSVLSEVRPLYPKEAREKELEGSVALDVLIDEKGKVRQVSVIEGPLIFRQDAIEAMKKFTFRPAKVDGKAVAVRIRYSLKFQLEY
jgi:TonB family protein